MKLVSNRKWLLNSSEDAEKIKKMLLDIGAKEEKINNPHEKWRFKYFDSTITYYESKNKRTLFITDSDCEEVLGLHKYIDSIIGSRFILPTKEYLVGLDEVGKGEVIGHVILVGVIFPSSIFQEIDRFSGVADTKVKRTVQFWEGIFNKLDFYKSKGLMFLVEKIPPWDFDKYNINNLMDLIYQRILNYLSQKIPLDRSRIVIDDYGIGPRLKKFLESLKNAGAEVVITHRADEQYLESRIASLIAKYYQQKSLEAIYKNPEFKLEGEEIGSGNVGDVRTINYLKKWWSEKKKWPWFVKQSFKPIREIEGKREFKKIKLPPLNESLISQEFREKFYNGKLNITSLMVNCYHCGQTLKSFKLIFKEQQTTAICINCKKEIEGISDVLRYFCGKILPDTSTIIRGFISKDLENTKFFENFTILIHPIVRKESDNRGGKRELERLGHYHSIGRIKLEEIEPIDNIPQENIERDKLIQKGAIENNAILLTGDKGMMGLAQAKNLFVIEI